MTLEKTPLEQWTGHVAGPHDEIGEVTPEISSNPTEPSLHRIKNVVQDRIEDPNLDHDLVDDAEQALDSDDVKLEAKLEHLFEDDSPYPEVRASVSNVDDPHMPYNTFRLWLLGLIVIIVVPGLNQLLNMRYPTTTVTPYCVMIVVYPMGKFLAWVLPTRIWSTRFGSWSLNPGPFNVKEHTLLALMTLMSSHSAYATSIPTVQRFTLGVGDWGIGYGILLIVSTQLLGVSFASFCRRFLIWPSQMIWPQNLPKAALLNSLHGIQTSQGAFPGVSRFKFFWLAFLVLFFYQFFPTYIFAMLSIGNWFCLISPTNVPLNQMLGSQSGLGLLPFTFDWTVINSVIHPLYSPWWSLANLLGGFVIFYVILCPALYYSNTWNMKYLPMFSSSTFDRFGQKYNASNVSVKLPSGGLRFVPEMYDNYSGLYIPSALAISYFLAFASVSGVIVHVALFHGKALWCQLRTPPKEANDVHMRLMSKYKEAPYWWYLAVFLAAFGMGVGAIHGWPTGMHAGHFVLAIVIGAIFLLPVGVVTAISNQEVGLNMLSELIIGYILPGFPIAMMIFKSTMYTVSWQGVQFAMDQKLAHYMKVPPRATFIVQTVAATMGGIVNILVQQWAFSNIEGICRTDQPDKFTCAPSMTFGQASIVWGLVGPKYMFSPGRPYNALLYGFLVGAAVPLVMWLLALRFPKGPWRLINIPVMFAGIGSIPPATGIQYTAPILVGFLTQFVWKRFHSITWSKYNYILAAALEGASAIAVVFIFFTLQFPKGANQHFLNAGWWGNSAYKNTADYKGTPYLHAPKNGFQGTPAQLGLAS